MKNVERQLLDCLTAYRLGRETAVQVDGLCAQDWLDLHKLAAAHKLGAVACETLWKTSGFCGGDRQLASAWQKETILQAVAQSGRTQRLLRLVRRLESGGVPYAVVKGAVCRELYTRPDLRISGDEDILIAAEDFSRCSELFRQDGMAAADANEGAVTHWIDRGTGLHVELHTELFSSRRSADRLLNDCFSRQLGQTVAVPAAGGTLRTLAPTYHFLFLVCHALKHFISGGFGIRTLCDIVTFGERYGGEIDRQTVYSHLEQVGGRVFLDQLLSIGQEYLECDLTGSGWTLSAPPDAGEMLEDILDAGIYGQSSMSRRHSGALVLRAAEEGQSRPSLLRAVFPPREQLVGRYPVLRRVPVLLPALWVHRLGVYGLELLGSRRKDNSPRESVALGKKRTEMMIKYGIIPQDKRED